MFSSAKSPDELLMGAHAGEAAKRALARAFCELAQEKGETAPAALEAELTMYASEQDLVALIVKIGDMADLKSYVGARVAVPSIGE
jgi:hypothetical protein